MNEERFNYFWLYVLDLHNHSAVGDLRHAVNPTSPYRMELILKAAMLKKSEEGVLKAPEVGEVGAEALVSELASLSLTPKDQVSCQCTRKCKTKQCACFKQNILCNSMCHPHNNTCTNHI